MYRFINSFISKRKSTKNVFMKKDHSKYKICTIYVILFKLVIYDIYNCILKLWKCLLFMISKYKALHQAVTWFGAVPVQSSKCRPYMPYSKLRISQNFQYLNFSTTFTVVWMRLTEISWFLLGGNKKGKFKTKRSPGHYCYYTFKCMDSVNVRSYMLATFSSVDVLTLILKN